jgi:wyosine [tRNA(Phe)-imidazoG37] synthetase (radical SAM superfamily)
MHVSSPCRENPVVVTEPVRSGRFGRGIEVHNLPLERCSYACVYCGHVPRAHHRIRRRSFLPAHRLVRAVEETLRRCDRAGERVDHVVIAPDGEPTLDVSLGTTLRLLGSLGVPLAVVTNGSLLWQTDVRSALSEADLVSVRIDAVEPERWRRSNRPVRQLRLPTILEGMAAFAREFDGELWTESTLVEGINDDPAGLRMLARFVGSLAPSRAFLSVPTTPPAPRHVHGPSDAVLEGARLAFQRHAVAVEMPVAVHAAAGPETLLRPTVFDP